MSLSRGAEDEGISSHTIGRMLLDLFASLTIIYNRHGSPRENFSPDELRSTLRYEATFLLPRRFDRIPSHRNQEVRSYRSLRMQAPVTNALLDWLDQRSQGRFQPCWISSILFLEMHCIGTLGLSFEVLWGDSPDVAEWADVCDKVAEQFLASRSRFAETRLEWRRIANALQDLKQVVHFIGPYIDQRSGAAYALSLFFVNDWECD